jgi:hypothetical protein
VDPDHETANRALAAFYMSTGGVGTTTAAGAVPRCP